MPIIFEMPSLSPTMEKGNLVTWCKKEGDEIAVGDVIAEIDTDKATMEVESIYKGRLEKILVQAGTHDVAVKTPIAIIRQKNDTDEDIQKTISNLNKGEQKGERNESINTTVTNIIQNHVQENTTTKASPLAKRLANEFGIDISCVTGTGPHGRIVKQDVLNVRNVKEQNEFVTNTPSYTDVPISPMRKVIADKLTKTKQEVPHFYMTIKANVTSLLDVRRKINEAGMLDTKITVTDLLIKAVALAMKAEPGVNVMWRDGNMRQFGTIDISVAVATDSGLITPIIWNADIKSIKQISAELKTLSAKAKDNELKPNEFIGGNITISNLGMFGVNSFFSIINSPQGSILSISSTQKEAAISESNDVVVADMLSVGYAIDHRVIDGATAAKFLTALKDYLENPLMLLV
ncbi:MAG: 2-oxo acid dehydrogenase subunit E2 [Alphaproteobacteria bacterium]|nr:2-oxo acid dehydrogenase subunit E2 [Alphaproteobacteria bacterium]